jgi:NAD(P)H-hydrate repair Nnr-like enzyme with NAD(P)H-hydrate dehydratase domain
MGVLFAVATASSNTSSAQALRHVMRCQGQQYDMGVACFAVWLHYYCGDLALHAPCYETDPVALPLTVLACFAITFSGFSPPHVH